MNQQRIIQLFIALVELFIITNAIFFIFIFCAWMESDNFAHSANEFDWWVQAAKRFFIATFLSFMAAFFAYFINVRLFLLVGIKRQNFAVSTSLVFLTAMLISGLVGALMFAVTKPYM